MDRLDEFDGEVESLIGSIRPNVLKNYQKNAEIEENKGHENLIKFINQEALQFIPFSTFSSIHVLGQLKKKSNIILEKFKDSRNAERYLFLSNLLLEEPKPVNIEYYINVLYFLIELHKLNFPQIRSPYGNSSKEILIYWIGLLLFGFGKKRELRYLWAFEGLIQRLTMRLLILSPESRTNWFSSQI